jgi:transcriptional antiterminator NusG
LAVNTDTFYPFNLGETIKVVDGPLMVSMVQLKINEEKRKLEVMVKIFGRKHH